MELVRQDTVRERVWHGPGARECEGVWEGTGAWEGARAWDGKWSLRVGGGSSTGVWDGAGVKG